VGNPSALSLGPGTLYTAQLLSTEPSDLVTAWPAAWAALGYTHEGNDWSYQLNTEGVDVAEELDFVRIVPTGRVIQVKFVLAEITATNLSRALNGGTIVTGSGFVTYEPPAFGTEIRKMYGWQSDDGQERWVFRQCMSGGTVEMGRKKGAAKAGIAFELNLEKPTGVQPFKVIMASPARA
jgi:hypothetical protein